MEHLPLVSIITPAYNQAEYLAETIESVLAQDYPNIEYIVLDDGSTDATAEVLRRYDGRIRWESQKNMGQARTLNKGWAMAKGSILGYISSDDRLLPNAVTQLVHELAKHSQTVVAYCDFDLIDKNGRIIRHVTTEDYQQSRLIEDLVCQPGPGALFHRHAFDWAGGWQPELRQIPDFEFWLRVSRRGPFIRVPQTLAEYRIHEGSASFRAISYERSMEIVHTMQHYWGNENSEIAKKSIANAHLIAAKSHAQSGRYFESLQQLQKSISYNPASGLSLRTWRYLASGLFRRIYHKRISIMSIVK